LHIPKINDRAGRTLPPLDVPSRRRADSYPTVALTKPVSTGAVVNAHQRAYEAIEKTASVVHGTGSTFRALADHGLIQIEEREYNVHGQPKPYIRIKQTGILSRAFRTPRTAHWSGSVYVSRLPDLTHVVDIGLTALFVALHVRHVRYGL
jgi:hypothetical protein